MAKYIDTEKLKTYIEYHIKKDNCKFLNVSDLLSFIDSECFTQDFTEEDYLKEAEAIDNWHNEGWGTID